MKKKLLPLVPLLLLLLAPLFPARADRLRVDFFDAGKADCALVTLPDGARILVDAGTNKFGKSMTERLTAEGVSRIDMLLITHYDKDHVGGADSVLHKLDVAKAVMPVYEKDSKQYDQFCAALDASPRTLRVPLEAGGVLNLSMGGAEISIGAAQKTYYGEDEENDFSLSLRIVFGDTVFLFAGDAEDARQTELLLEGIADCDVLKVPYHGRLVDVSTAFLSAASPKIAFIPDSEEESASPQVIAILQSLGTDVRSARNGNLTVFSDGRTVWAEP